MPDVSRETEVRLRIYEDLILKWNPRINLVSPSTLHDFQQRHLEDSLQLLGHVTAAPVSWLDLGSGGGLPALVVAAALQDEPTRFTLLESDARKAVFLRTAVREMSLERVQVLNFRIEKASPQAADLISARALAPLDDLLSWVERHSTDGGSAVFMKGRSWREEIAAAQLRWRFHYTAVPSKTDPEAAILKISKVARVR